VVNKILAVVNAIMAIIGLIATVAGVFWFMENRHLLRTTYSVGEVEMRKEILDTDIKKDAEARHHYEKKKLIGTADEADLQRLEYLENQLLDKYEKQEKLNDLEAELKRGDNK
jgi:hypothetical protein